MCEKRNSMDYEKMKRERFVKIAENRTNKIIAMIKLLGNCSNKSNYAYDDNDIKQIFNAIDDELKISKSRFQEAQTNKKEFKLK
jgi:hypothetical protein